MYKLLLFLKKTDEKQIINHFKDYTIKYLSELTGEEVKIASIESNLLLDQKYLYFCEISAPSKDDWDKLLDSPEGKTLNKDLMDFHSHVTAIFVNYN